VGIRRTRCPPPKFRVAYWSIPKYSIENRGYITDCWTIFLRSLSVCGLWFMICVVSISDRSTTNLNGLLCTRTEAAFAIFYWPFGVQCLCRVRVRWAGADGCCRKISGSQAAASSPKDIATSQPHVLLAHRPSSLQYAQGILPDPDPSVTPSSRPLHAPIPPFKTLSRIIAAGWNTDGLTTARKCNSGGKWMTS
jgi:hypothetical protein